MVMYSTVRAMETDSPLFDAREEGNRLRTHHGRVTANFLYEKQNFLFRCNNALPFLLENVEHDLQIYKYLLHEVKTLFR